MSIAKLILTDAIDSANRCPVSTVCGRGSREQDFRKRTGRAKSMGSAYFSQQSRVAAIANRRCDGKKIDSDKSI